MNTKLVSSTELSPTLHLCSSSSSSKLNQTSLSCNIIINSKLSYPSNKSSRLVTSIKTRSNSSSSSAAAARRRVTTAFYSTATEEAISSSSTETLYEVLGISESVETSSDVIKKAYKKMARKYHPDVSPPERVDEYTRKFILVHEAYETLSDPKTRALYDRELSLSHHGDRSNFNFSSRKFHQRMDEEREWKMRWQSQLDELKRQRDVGRQTSGNKDDNSMSWGARMRSQRSSS